MKDMKICLFPNDQPLSLEVAKELREKLENLHIFHSNE